MRTVFENGIIYRGRQVSGFDKCTTMVVNDDHVEYLGNDAARRIPELEHGNNYNVVDLGGRSVFPAFVDAHMHILQFGASLTKVGLDHCKSLTEIKHTITTAARSIPSAPRILCRGWKQSSTNRLALASMLDDIDPRPIYIDADDLHSAWCNTAALVEMGIDHNTPDPTDGTIHRDEKGNPTGLISEGAVISMVWPYLIGVMSKEEKIRCIHTAIQEYHTSGFTAIIEMAMDEGVWELLEELKQNGLLKIRIAAHWLIRQTGDDANNIAQVERAIELHQQYNLSTSPNLRIAGIKIICDGVIESCTAALSEPYLVAPLGKGELLWTPEVLQPVLVKADTAGLQIACHAIGDAAVHMAINALEKLGTTGHRHRIEHLEITRPEDAKRLGLLGITASIQPAHSDPAGLTAWPELIGPERCNWAFAHRDFHQHGAQLAIGTDVPTGPYLPLPNLYVANTRSSARDRHNHWKINERRGLEMHDAFSAATWGAAYSCFAENMIGSLDVGKKADFTVVEGFDQTINADSLLQAYVAQTWMDGEKIFSR